MLAVPAEPAGCGSASGGRGCEQSPSGGPTSGLKSVRRCSTFSTVPFSSTVRARRQFEADFAALTAAPHAVSVSSCTAGLHLVYFDLGIGAGRRGDRAGADARGDRARRRVHRRHAGVRRRRARRPATSTSTRSRRRITPRTRAICVVHYLGLPVDMDRLNAIARKHGLFVVEDCALAIGTVSTASHAGLLGDVGSFSFYPVKHITTAEGGMVITRARRLHPAHRAARRRSASTARSSERKVPGVYDVTMLGFNYRMNEIAGRHRHRADQAASTIFLQGAPRNYRRAARRRSPRSTSVRAAAGRRRRFDAAATTASRRCSTSSPAGAASRSSAELNARRRRHQRLLPAGRAALDLLQARSTGSPAARSRTRRASATNRSRCRSVRISTPDDMRYIADSAEGRDHEEIGR